MDNFPNFQQEFKDGKYKVEFLCIGEGKKGEYDPFDIDDLPLMRLFIYELKNGEYEEIHTAQTNIVASLSLEQLNNAFQFLVSQIAVTLDFPENLDKLMKFFSWAQINKESKQIFVQVGASL
jgi:hypothetical protein